MELKEKVTKESGQLQCQSKLRNIEKCLVGKATNYVN